MHHDLSGLQDDSLDHIARRMDDIRRRLGTRPAGRTRAGRREWRHRIARQTDQESRRPSAETGSGRRQCVRQAAAAQHADAGQPDRRTQRPGKVDRKDIGRGAGWGNLNDKDREKAMQEIGREFPSHYREVIEEYFRRLAAEESSDKP